MKTMLTGVLSLMAALSADAQVAPVRLPPPIQAPIRIVVPPPPPPPPPVFRPAPLPMPVLDDDRFRVSPR